MSEVTTELVLGAQSRAAKRVSDTAPVLRAALARLRDNLAGDTGGLAGSAAGEFYETLTNWFAVGKRIPEAILGYGGKLVTVDRNARTSLQEASTAYDRAARKLGSFE